MKGWCSTFFIQIIRKQFNLFHFFFLLPAVMNAQEPWYIEGNVFRGAILPHNDQISHLITEKPTGFLMAVNKPLRGDAYWQKHYNYPDVGISFHYQDNHNAVLGNLYGLYAHYNFYFFNRKFQFRIAQGIAYATHPYNAETNFRNMAYGSRFMPSTYFKISYERRNIWNNFGLNAGLLFVHHSNATIKSPNTSTNTLAVSAGLLYDIGNDEKLRKSPGMPFYSTQVRFNAVFRTGVNESHILGMGQKPFYHFSAMASKRLGYTGSIQAGAELFLSYTLKEMVPFMAHSFPELQKNPNADWKRIGVFAGYEMHFNKLSLEGQLGYYVHDEYKENGSAYQRLGLRYYVTDQVFGAMSLKTHSAKAEAFELGVGLKL